MKIILCDCGGEAIEIEGDKEYKSIYVSLWKHGNVNRPLSFKERIRWCLHILNTGNPWTDCLIFSKEKVIQLIEELNKALKEIEN